MLSTQQTISPETEQDKDSPFQFIKDPYIAEFLNMPEDLEGKESVLENAIIGNLQKFLLELVKVFRLLQGRCV